MYNNNNNNNNINIIIMKLNKIYGVEDVCHISDHKATLLPQSWFLLNQVTNINIIS